MKQLYMSLKLIIAGTVLLGGVYPLVMTGAAQLFFPFRANGSLMHDRSGNITGSELIGRTYVSSIYFRGRPSASGCDPLSSGGTNLGPDNGKLADRVNAAADAVRRENGLDANLRIPSELACASGSGLDPDISLEGALLQVPRVASVRRMDEATLEKIVYDASRRRYGVAGVRIVNVVKLNARLDERSQ
jgi:K+-transporting ATPase ATPase C chain